MSDIIGEIITPPSEGHKIEAQRPEDVVETAEQKAARLKKAGDEAVAESREHMAEMDARFPAHGNDFSILDKNKVPLLRDKPLSAQTVEKQSGLEIEGSQSPRDLEAILNGKVVQAIEETKKGANPGALVEAVYSDNE